MSLRSSLLNAQQRLSEIPAEQEAINQVAEDENRDLTDGELSQISDLSAEFDSLTQTSIKLQKAIEAKVEIDKRGITEAAIEQSQQDIATQYGQAKMLPAVPSHQRSKYFKNNRDAYAMGMWLGAALVGKEDCKRFCRQHGIGGFKNAQEEGTDSLGGYTVPTPLSAQIIELVEQWGVFRANSRNVTMTSETLAVPKLINEITPGTPSGKVFYPGEGGAITPETRTFGQVLLTAVKAAQLNLMSTEVNEDSIISMVDLLVRDFARHFAYAEDLNAFLGDGTATYGGITGVKSALQAGATVTAANAGAITLADFNSMAGKTRAYAGFMGAYYMNKAFWYDIVLPLLQAAGGTNMRQLEEGGRPILNGDPVILTQVMEDPGATAQVAVYGDLDLGSYMGTRRQVSIRTLTELYAATDQIGVIGTERYDVQIHSVGDATNAGAITNLITTIA